MVRIGFQITPRCIIADQRLKSSYKFSRFVDFGLRQKQNCIHLELQTSTSTESPLWPNLQRLDSVAGVRLAALEPDVGETIDVVTRP